MLGQLITTRGLGLIDRTYFADISLSGDIDNPDGISGDITEPIDGPSGTLDEGINELYGDLGEPIEIDGELNNGQVLEGEIGPCSN